VSASGRAEYREKGEFKSSAGKHEAENRIRKSQPRSTFLRRESQELAARLATCACASPPVTDRRTMCRFVRPQLVVEIRCSDRLAADNAED
jgi:hypothetical protein